MRNLIHYTIIAITFLMVSCSTSAYLAGYNLIAAKEREIGFDLGQENSTTADTLLSWETASIGNSEIEPLMVITVPTGIALSPVFFLLGNITGVLDSIPSMLTPVEQRPLIEKRKLANFSSSQETLAKLARDKDVPIKRYVAKNKYTAPKTLFHLAKDSESSVRAAVAKNPNTPIKTLLVLAKDKNPHVQYTALNNSRTPQEVKTKKQPQQKSKDKEEEGWWNNLPYKNKLEELWEGVLEDD